MDGFDREPSEGGPRCSIRSTSTFRTATRSRTSTWRTNGSSPTACSNRISTRASSAISTSSPRRPRSSVDLPYGNWGCGGGSTVATIGKDRTVGRTGAGRASITRRSATSSTRPHLSWRFYSSTYGSASSGDASFWSSYQAVKHIYYGPDWKKSLDAELAVHHRRARRTARQLHVDHAGLRRLRSRKLRRRLRPVVGRGARQYRRQEQVLELDRDLRAVGRLGRPLRSRAAARTKITTASVSAFRCW